MDRRMILAFVLIFLILTGYPLIMQKFFPQEAPPAGAVVDRSDRSPADEAPTTVVQDDLADTAMSPEAETTQENPPKDFPKAPPAILLPW